MFNKKELIYEVYKEKSFSKAANNLFIAQPSLSATIKKVEKDIGMKIFDRSTTPIKLTECGKEYIRCAETMLEIEKSFEDYLSDLNGLKKGSISIGTNHLYASIVLPSLISIFIEKYPNIKINVVEENSANLEIDLLSGKLDLVFDNHKLTSQTYDKYYFNTENLLLAVPKQFKSNESVKHISLSWEDIKQDKHLDKETHTIDLSNFKNDKFILMKNGNDTKERTNIIFNAYDINPNILFELDQLATLYHMISNGMAISIISDTLIKREHNKTELFFYKLNENYSKREVYFYRKRTKYKTIAVEKFIETAKTNNNL